jgi:AcrR family transcriptional regulator
MTTRTRGTLNREAIAAAALELIDREGLEALSMRRLADELGVGTMTLYGYFRGKEELIDAVIDQSVSDRDLRVAGTWRERASILAREMRAYLERHPALVQVRLRRPMTRPRQYAVTEQVVRALVDAGLPRAEAARAFRLLFTYVFGYVAFSPSATADAAREQVRSSLAALPPGEYPLLSSMAGEAAAAAAGDEQFEFGLELILDGIEARAARSS